MGMDTANNVLMAGGGVFRDAHDPDPARRCKALGGPLCAVPGGCPDVGPGGHGGYGGSCAGCTPGGGTASSGDGLVFGGGVPVPFHKPQRYNTHTNAFYDRR